MARIDRPDSTGGGAGSGGAAGSRGPKPRGPKPKPVPTPKPPRTTGGIGGGNRNRIAPVYQMTAPIPKPTPKPSLPPVPPKSVTAKNSNPQPTLKPARQKPTLSTKPEKPGGLSAQAREDIRNAKPTPTDIALGRLGTPSIKGGKIVHSSGEQVRMQPKSTARPNRDLIKKPSVVKPTPKPTPTFVNSLDKDGRIQDPTLPRIIKRGKYNPYRSPIEGK